jgi:hypothetical protein
MEPLPDHSKHWVRVLNLVHAARDDEQLRYRLRTGTPKDLEFIMRDFDVSLRDLELCRADLGMFEGPTAYGKWFYLEDSQIQLD